MAKGSSMGRHARRSRDDPIGRVRHTGRVSIEIPVECRLIYRSSVDRHIGRQMPFVHKIRDRVSCNMHVGREATDIDQHIARVSTDTSTECRSRLRSSVDRYIGRVSTEISDDRCLLYTRSCYNAELNFHSRQQGQTPYFSCTVPSST